MAGLLDEQIWLGAVLESEWQGRFVPSMALLKASLFLVPNGELHGCLPCSDFGL